MIQPLPSELQHALELASDTKFLRIGRGATRETASVFAAAFGARAAVVVADRKTFEVLGLDVCNELRAAGVSSTAPFVFTDASLYAENSCVEQVQQSLASHDAIPIAVGSGTINDLTKLAAHRVGRPYMVVATAASMDGYTAFGASITLNDAKQTIECPAPRAVVADLDVIANAPVEMNAWGYADLLAKITAGADWILADELGVESIHQGAWRLVQGSLRQWLSNPIGIRRGDFDAIASLTTGLLMSGFAIQAARTSRAASGAEHQFSHLWDMQHHTHNGVAPSHGAKVGVATVAVARFYEYLMARPVESMDVDVMCTRWPEIETIEDSIGRLFAPWPELIDGAKRETRAKYITRDQLREQLTVLRSRWPAIKQRLTDQLIPSRELARMLIDAGAPSEPDQIGISRDRLIKSFRLACHIRRRFTVLDLADRLGALEEFAALV